MNRKFRLILSGASVLMLVGCETTPQQQPQVNAPASTSQPSVKALSELSEIQEELKLLRNSIEELQFETENAKRRQQDLFQDLDRRLLTIERSARLPNAADSNAISSGIEGGFASSNNVIPGSGDNQLESDSDLVTVTGTQDGDEDLQLEGETGQSVTNLASVNTGLGSVTVDEQQAYEDAFEMLKQSRYEDSILLFQQLVDTWPNSELADDSYYWMSEARYVNREFEHALSGFRTVVTRYPDSQRVPEALLKIGYIQYDIGTYDEAAETFRDILARFPGHQVTVSAQTRLRRIEQTIQ